MKPFHSMIAFSLLLAGCVINHPRPSVVPSDRPLSDTKEATGRFKDEDGLGGMLSNKGAQMPPVQCEVVLIQDGSGKMIFSDSGKVVFEWPFTYTVEEDYMVARASKSEALPADNGIVARSKTTLRIRPDAQDGLIVRCDVSSGGLFIVVPLAATDQFWFRLSRLR